jgi:EAL domain-containing protein (putative c-di-GMP-specific phosphodiesterase class I)
MKDISPQRFGMMGNFHNSVSELIDASQLTPSEVYLVLEMINSDMKHLVMAKVNVTRERR